MLVTHQPTQLVQVELHTNLHLTGVKHPLYFVGRTCCIWFRECIRCILHVYSWYYISCFGGEFQVQYNAFISWMYYLTFDSFSGMCDLIQSFFFAAKVSIFSHFKPKEIASNGRLQHSHECPAAKKRLIIAAMACNNLWLEPDRVLLFFNSSKTKCALPFRDSITVLGFASILPFFKHKAWKLHWLLKRSVWKAVKIGVCGHARLAMHYALYACALKVGFESLWCGTCVASCLRW